MAAASSTRSGAARCGSGGGGVRPRRGRRRCRRRPRGDRTTDSQVRQQELSDRRRGRTLPGGGGATWHRVRNEQGGTTWWWWAAAAGLSAALVLGRARRRVVVVDGGAPGTLRPPTCRATCPGRPAAVGLVAIGREEVRAYGVELIDGRAGGRARLHGRVLADGRRLSNAASWWPRAPATSCPTCPGSAKRWGRPAALPLLPRLGGAGRAARRARHPPARRAARAARAAVVRRRGLLRPRRAGGGGGRAALVARGVRIEPSAVAGLVVDDDRLRRRARRRPGGAATAVFVRPASGRTRRAPPGLGPSSMPTGSRWSTPRGARAFPACGARATPWIPQALVITAAGQGSAAAIAINADLVRDDVERSLAARPAPADDRRRPGRGDRAHGRGWPGAGEEGPAMEAIEVAPIGHVRGGRAWWRTTAGMPETCRIELDGGCSSRRPPSGSTSSRTSRWSTCSTGWTRPRSAPAPATLGPGGLALVGILGQRAKDRPNRIGVTTCVLAAGPGGSRCGASTPWTAPRCST